MSQGESATVWMFVACWSMTPRDTAGGRRPRPRNESEVSLMIIAGSASVVAAMMWLMKSGTMCTKMKRCALARGPADERQDERDREIHLEHGPIARHGRGESHPQRDRRHRGDDLD